MMGWSETQGRRLNPDPWNKHSGGSGGGIITVDNASGPVLNYRVSSLGPMPVRNSVAKVCSRRLAEAHSMKFAVVKKRSITIAGHKTSISLEDEFWKSLREIADERDETVSQLIASIDTDREFANLSSALRLFILRYYRDQLDQQNEMVAPPLDLDPSNSVDAH
jgi:predicted DNA-binding ribbon-helix-helix protein